MSEEVENRIVVSCYIERVKMVRVMMGMRFEIGIVRWVVGKVGMLCGDLMGE